ncbi:MAG: sulfite exporter TauE/SafE family protein, partial [Clostridia bacterium]|nr:sulfite exporter TauE/SafE family protein [Clostridia bacterium]
MKIEKNQLAENTGKFAPQNKKKERKSTILLALAGVFIGAVNGLFGAGGGMVAVPVLSIIAGLDAKRAHATAIL